MIKLIILGAFGAAGYAAYRYLEKTGGLPTSDQVNDFVDTVKESVGMPKSAAPHQQN